MVIGVDFFNYGFDQQYYDTPIPTAEIDEVTLGAAMYDELYITVDDEADRKQEKPSTFNLKTIMDAGFNNSLEAGSINGSGHIVTRMQMYRREYQNAESQWHLISNFDYDEHYNTYTVVDRFVQNGTTYEYSIVPLAKEVMGDVLVGPPIKAEFNGSFISDIGSNYSMNVDFKFSDVTYNTNMNKEVPLNGAYPIVSFGNANYRTGSITFLPLTPEQEFGYKNQIDPRAELMNRNRVINFLNNGLAKVIRREDGDLLVVATNNVRTEAKAEGLDALSTVTFDFTEIGGLDFNTMDKSGLISSAGKSVYTYDDNGNIVWNQEYQAADRYDVTGERYRNAFAPAVDRAKGVM